MTAFTDIGINFYRGAVNPGSDQIEEYLFDEYEPLAGFVGYETNKITALGFYKYKCMERPDDLGDRDVDETDEEENGGTVDEGEEVDNGDTETGDNTDPVVDNGDGDTDVTDPDEEEENTEGDGEGEDDKTDTVTDPDADEAFSDKNKDVIKDEELLVEPTSSNEDDSDGLVLILIILLCIMIPLLCILLGICWLFRKNKVNAVAAAEERRRSSIMKQKTFEAA